MSEDPSCIGLQHPAFAVSKTVLLTWLNDFFELDYAKVEQCATGAVYCQIVDCIFGLTKGQFQKINWTARNDYEFVNNFKIVQKVMMANNISKPIPIDKLVKAKYQDNLEFLQWFKHFFECRYNGEQYNAKERRGGKGGSGPKRVVTSSRTKTTTTAAAKKTTTTRPTSGRSTTSGSKADAEAIKALNEEIASFQATVEGLEKERDFYFGKLREVEVLCQGDEELADGSLKAEVLKILYKTDEEEAAAAEEEVVEEAEAEDETF